MLHSHGGEDLELRHLTAADGAEGQNVTRDITPLLPKGAQEIQKGQVGASGFLGTVFKRTERKGELDFRELEQHRHRPHVLSSLKDCNPGLPVIR